MPKHKKSISRTVTFCGTAGCCPTATFNSDSVIIKDDFGGSVKLTKKQFKELQKVK